MAAGMLIVLLLASLVGIRVRRRRAERGTLPAPEPRTLLNAPSGPLATSAGDARHARETAGQRAAATHMAAPGATPWRTAPGAQDRRPYAQAPGQAAPIWSPNRPGPPGAPAAPASGTPPRILPVPGAPAFPGPSSSGRAGRPGEPGTRREPGIPEAAPSRPAPSRARGSAPGGRTRRRARIRGRSGRYRTSSRISAHGLRAGRHAGRGHGDAVTGHCARRAAVGAGPHAGRRTAARGDAPGRGSVRPVPAAGPGDTRPLGGTPPGHGVPPGPPPTAGQPGATRPYARPAGTPGEPPPIPPEPWSPLSRRPGPAGSPPPATASRAPPRPGSPSAGPLPPIGPRFHGQATLGHPRRSRHPGPGGAGPLDGRLPIARPSSFAGPPGPPPGPSPGPRRARPVRGTARSARLVRGREPQTGPVTVLGQARLEAGAGENQGARARPPRREPGRRPAVGPALRLESGCPDRTVPARVTA